ncbi:MAG: rod shape-determining protein MreD [Vicingus serpentipes]|nr:rod shape-determining protein MreD [Vicingus serpentipes]
MIGDIIKYSLIFILLILFQGLILNNIEMGGYINPYLYVLFILILPFQTPKWLSLVLGFILGLSIDIFTSTIGMHTSATIFMAFARTYLLAIIRPRDGYDFNTTPNLQQMGGTWFLIYSSILVFLHHLFLFFVESFKFSQFFDTLGRAILSTIFTITMVFIVQLFNFKNKNRV